MKLYVPIEAHEFARLVELAQSKKRRPQDQAALFVLRGLDAADRERPPEAGDPVPTAAVLG